MTGLHLRLQSVTEKSAGGLWDPFINTIARQLSHSPMAKAWTFFFLVSIYPRKPEPWGDRHRWKYLSGPPGKKN